MNITLLKRDGKKTTYIVDFDDGSYGRIRLRAGVPVYGTITDRKGEHTRELTVQELATIGNNIRRRNER